MNKQSNHPPSVLQSVSYGIIHRLANMSSNKQVFDQAARPYQQVLHNSGYTHRMEYECGPNNKKINKRKRPRKIIWFNPLYSANIVAKKIRKNLFKCLATEFPANHKLHKRFNKSPVKLSYCGVPNIKTILNNHNKKILAHQHQPVPIYVAVVTPTYVLRMANANKNASLPSHHRDR